MPHILESLLSIPTTTAGDIILRAHRILGNKGSGESLNGNEGPEGLDALRTMVEGFGIEKLMIYQNQQETFTWPASTVSRTIGPNGDFDTTRPIRIRKGTFFRDSLNIDYPVRILRDRETYDLITDKTVTSTYPESLFYDPVAIDAVMYVYPVTTQSLTLHLNSWKPLQLFYYLTTELIMPPGYKRMLEYNLAVELEGEVGLALSPGARKIAINSKNAIKRINHRPIVSATETYHILSNHRRGHDIYEGK